MDSYTLGLDIGSNSIGWALVQTHPQSSIIAIGVRVFPEGVDRDTKGLEKSKNATRREARGARRVHQRRSQRKEQLKLTLQTVSLLPNDESVLRSLFQSNPYQLRKKGLDEKLESYEFGRILYHLSQRRGFKSNRKSGKAKEDGVVIKGASALQTEIDNKKCRTIGEYFAGLNPDEQRIRGRYTFRSMYEQEFDLLWAKQEEHYPDVLTEDLRKKIRDEVIFFQRPLKPTDELIGECELEPGEKRCPRGDWYARRFRLLQDVNNLKIQNPDGTELELSSDQRKTILDELDQKDKLTFDKIREKLGLIESQRFNAEYRISKSGKTVESMKGDVFVAAMRGKSIFGPKKWDAMDEQEKMRLNEWLIEFDDDQLKEKLQSEYSFESKQTEAVLKIPLPPGYMSFSKKAIMKLLEFMEQGAITSEAIAVVYRDRDAGAQKNENLNKLPLPEDLRNPIVNKALFEVRKVVNAIVREYVKPTRIKIEMARDVQGSRRQREELHWKQRENEERNNETRKRLREDIGIASPTREDVIKYNLWDECGKVCPYTGKHISQQALFGPNPEFQIEHILPYDRSLDDSFMNKTLCEVHENIHVKRNQTPFEAYNHDPARYEQIKQNIKVLPWPKRQKFLQKEIDLDQHISRELNDTRYICKEVAKYIKQLGAHVTGTRGKITSELRHQWGLDGIFDEIGTRRDDDHRRHAVDAIVVAVTENEHLRKLAASKYSVTGESFDPPWLNFRDEVREKVRFVKVSHRVQRKVSGKLHEETNYGPTKEKNKYVFRKKLRELTPAMAEDIVDPVVREIVRNRMDERGADFWKETLYMKRTKSNKSVPIKTVRILDTAKKVIALRDRSGQAYRCVKSGSNHHVEIFVFAGAKGIPKRDSRVVTMFEAVQRNQKGEPIVRKNYGDGGNFVCSLAINDMVMMKNKAGEMDLYRVQKMDANKMVRFRHHAASTIDCKETYVDKTAHLFEGYKVTIDPLGRIWPAND